MVKIPPGTSDRVGIKVPALLNLSESILPIGTEFGEFTVLSGENCLGHNEVMDFFYNYWLSKHDGDHLPARTDLRPSEMARHLDHLVIMDVGRVGDSFSLTVRLIGTHVANFYGEISGKDIHEMTNSNAAQRIYHLCALVVTENRPQMSVTPAFAPDRQYLEAYALYLPLYGASGDVEKILVAVEVKSLHSDTRF